jgi:GNAT superfamily N-acetyltransferase
LTFTSEPINDPLTGAEGFDSTNESLDNWLRTTAVTMHRANMGRTWLWRDQDEVVAYYHLTPHDVKPDTIPNRNRFGKDRIIPGFLIAKLALDKRVHGKGHGSALLFDALARVAGVSEQVGGRIVVVDAIDENAAGFYRAHGFKDARADDPTRPQRLIMAMDTIFETLAADAD